jgi:DNA-binding NarL/FixJ family response regulator
VTAPLRVLIADDQRVVRDGLVMLVGLIDGLQVVGTAANGAEAIALTESERPDVVLMDLQMPEVDGAEATRRIRGSSPETQVLVLTTYADDASLFPALQAGARGYLTKDASAEEIEQAIRAVAEGRTHLEAAIQARLIAAVVGEGPASGQEVMPPSMPPDDPPTPPDDPSSTLPDGLTPREVEVLKLIAAGLSNAEIAEALVVSAATVKTHVNRVFYKTGARDRAQAVRYAYQHDLI